MPDHRYWIIIRYEDGRPTEYYEVGDDPDLRKVAALRKGRGLKLEAIGAHWRSSHELWCEYATVAVRFYPLFHDDIPRLQEAMQSVFAQSTAAGPPTPSCAPDVSS